MARWITLLFGLLAVGMTMTLHAQETTPEPDDDSAQVVNIEATDGVTLVADYYDGRGTAVLLLHQLYTTRHSWGWVAESLSQRGYRVLAPDLRGYGQSRGAINWTRAQDDVQMWIDWLADEHGVQSAFIMGSSMGANLALVGCADAPRCSGAVALSPGLNYFGVHTDSAVTSGERILLVYGSLDMRPRRDIPRMWALAEEAGMENRLSEIVYEGRSHGMALFNEDDTLLTQIVAWMRERQ